MRTRVYEHLSRQCWETTAQALAQPGANADAPPNANPDADALPKAQAGAPPNAKPDAEVPTNAPTVAPPNAKPNADVPTNAMRPAGRSTHTKKASPAGSSTDRLCPHCSQKCSGTRGLASHLRLRGHRRHCKGAASGNKPMPPAPGTPAAQAAPGTPGALAPAPADPLTCHKCSKLCKSAQGLNLHLRSCKKVLAVAEEAEGIVARTPDQWHIHTSSFLGPPRAPPILGSPCNRYLLYHTQVA